MEAQPQQRTRPSLHLLVIVTISIASVAGYAAVIVAGRSHGYEADKMVAARDLGFLFVIVVLFFWLVRRQKYKGEMLLLSSAVLLFAAGSLMQYRLFSDPEYGARGTARTHARQLKDYAVRMRNIETAYDDTKKQFMFGAAIGTEQSQLQDLEARQKTSVNIFTSENTYIPLAAFVLLAIGFLIFRREETLLWFQRHSLIIGVVTMIPFALAVLLFSEEGKFLGQTTPWEPVKILFLLSFAGALANTYRQLRRTRWGVPPFRDLMPFGVIAAMPVIPFFALSDFGQMMVFFGVYILLYIVAVRKKIQIAYGVLLVASIFGVFLIASKARTGLILPSRVYFRFYMWRNTWDPPPPDTAWWKHDFDHYLKAKGLDANDQDQDELNRVNREAWSDKVLQQSQGLFGVSEGRIFGKGYGLGYPETIPISDSDFIYAAVSEESGLLGGLAILIAVAAFVIAGTGVSLNSSDMFTKLIAAGLTGFIGFQAIVNIGGVLRLLPMTGITLPFVSHGGWSLMTSFAMLGILMALSHRSFKEKQVQVEQRREIPA
ncbi:MAG: FtsW/RodA/SpoVE family cell cycle protein [Blastocatellia bacterium]